MKPQKRGKYTLKTYDSYLYTWSPQTVLKKPTAARVLGNGCNAPAGSQGEDWVCTYVYEINIINGIQARIAYVECDYVV